MNQQAMPPVPQQKSGAGKWLMGCGIAAIVVLIAVGGLAWWGISKAKDFAKDFANEWGDNFPVGMAAMAVKFDPQYELREKDPAAGTLTVENKSTGEVSVWRMGGSDEENKTFYMIDDKGRRVDMKQGEHSPGESIFTVGEVIETSEPSAADGGVDATTGEDPAPMP
ncbi:hypothetical protein [Sulfuriroseicoccus oceanibius]|uniref:Uncharacterized protein n=1 Tax=Sulfuriroseicoccus oceanibius TaxID=2707525 RepID=A0A6B3L724_9BACT|nr:hypothetical protein [Sulfuriroseicoccus oceanibius]QQL43858.1 hypothetical protein G3M56_008095 [Sulfuriroseicoccus oceanibius]